MLLPCPCPSSPPSILLDLWPCTNSGRQWKSSSTSAAYAPNMKATELASLDVVDVEGGSSGSLDEDDGGRGKAT